MLHGADLHEASRKELQLIIESGLDDASEMIELAEETPEAEVREWRVLPSGHGERLDKHLVQQASEFSRTHLQHLIQSGEVQIDGRVENTPARKLRTGQWLRVVLRPTAQAQAFRPEAMALSIVFEDDALMVIDKPVGLVVHPAPGHWSGTLLNGVLAHHPAAASLPRAGIVHRLDKDTSGLMVVAKSRSAHDALVAALALREVKRQYVAVAWGAFPSQATTIDQPIGRDARHRLRMAVVASGKPSRTTVTAQGYRGGLSAVVCALHTGRTHQIRVHLSHLGFPLVGDSLYGGKPWGALDRQALHAQRLGFQHPQTGEPLEFVAPLPHDLQPLWSWVMDGVLAG